MRTCRGTFCSSFQARSLSPSQLPSVQAQTGLMRATSLDDSLACSCVERIQDRLHHAVHEPSHRLDPYPVHQAAVSR